MDVSPRIQRKAAVFVTRRRAGLLDLALCWHAGGGHQLPAGTIEEGETFADGALREAIEETGLTNLTFVAELGSEERALPDSRGVLLDPVPIRRSPGGTESGPPLPRTNVEVAEVRGDWTLIRYVETDLEDPDRGEITRMTGWVPTRSVGRRQQRRFFRMMSADDRTTSWQVEAEPGLTFEVSWYRLDDRPRLAGDQEQWIERFGRSLR